MRWSARCKWWRGAVRALALVAAVAIAAATALEGQLALGAQASSGDNSGFGVGPRLVLDLGPFDAGLRIAGSFELFFPGDDFVYAETSVRDLEEAGVSTSGIEQDYWELNVNVLYSLGPPLVPLRPYVGGGLNFAHTERSGFPEGLLDVDRTDRGVNLLGGLELDVGGVSPYVEVRLSIDGGEQWVLTGGILF